MTSLRELLEAIDPDNGLALPAGWTQGRTAYGGLTAACALHAAHQCTDEVLGPLRSAQIGFVGPAQGQLRFVPSVLRAGRSVTSIGVDVHGEAGIAARVLLVFGHARSGNPAHDFSQPPPVRGPESYPALQPPPDLAPAFIANFELRPAAGALPLSGSDNPEQVVWVAHRDSDGVAADIALLAAADALPPAALAACRKPTPASTVTWSLDLLGEAGATPWYLLRSASVHAGDGYSVQTMQAWDLDGRMLLRGRQCVAVFG